MVLHVLTDFHNLWYGVAKKAASHISIRYVLIEHGVPKDEIQFGEESVKYSLNTLSLLSKATSTLLN